MIQLIYIILQHLRGYEGRRWWHSREYKILYCSNPKVITVEKCNMKIRPTDQMLQIYNIVRATQ